MKAGDTIQAVWGPYHLTVEAQAGAEVGKRGCLSIEIIELNGPMGYYLAASATYQDGTSIIFPLHMMEEIVCRA